MLPENGEVIGFTDEEKQTFDEAEKGIFPPSDIVAFNEQRSCADLFRMYKAKSLDIQPAFQRDIVWQKAQKTRFIDSLSKGLPIPSMCFAYDYNNEKRIVIDGLQRMATIINFLDEESDWQLSTLDDVNSRPQWKNDC